MPLYHFHDAAGARNVDSVGTELPNDAAARMMATEFVAELLKDQPARLWQAGQWCVEVTDADNLLLFTVKAITEAAPEPKQLPAND